MSFSFTIILALVVRLILALCVLAGLSFLVALPYLRKERGTVRPARALTLGLLPALAVGVAPVVTLVGVLVIRGSNFIYPAYACLIVGVVAGTIGPALMRELRRRMWLGWPLLLAWAYLSLIMVMAGSGMPVRLDSPVQLLLRIFN